MFKKLNFLFYSFFLLGCNNTELQQSKAIDDLPTINFTIVNRLPHDTNSFTEGLLFHNNQLFESTGAPEGMPNACSMFGIVDTTNGKIDKKVELDRTKYFGEGIVFLNGLVYQLTYRSKICFVYDEKTFTKVKQFNYQNEEGWGMTTDGKLLIMSDGTHVLRFLNPVDFKVVKEIQVTSNNFAAEHLNELEYINDYIYANVWPGDKIVKINPTNGNVVAKIDLKPLKEEVLRNYSKSLETNGIAYDSVSKKILVTGKMWPTIFQIEFNQ